MIKSIANKFALSNKEIITFNIFSLLIWIFLGSLGSLSNVTDLLEEIMKISPVSNLYFLIFSLLTLIIPMIIYAVKNVGSLTKKILGSYLLYLIAQIIIELIIVLEFGKGYGPLIGFYYSLIRLVQLMVILIKYKRHSQITYLCSAGFILWGYNVTQIILNRLIPVISIKS